MAGPTSKPFIKAFACAGVVFAMAIFATWALLGPLNNSYDASRLAGRLFAVVVLAALVTGFFARRSAKAWSLARIIATYIGTLIVLVALYAIGTRTN